MTLLERLNRDDHFARSIGARLTEVKVGYARAELDVTDTHLNGAGICQGGNTITFMQSARLGDHLVAECTEQLDHHRLPYCDMKITNQNGELIAAMTGLAYRTGKEYSYDTFM